jgi:hypothetical protein
MERKREQLAAIQKVNEQIEEMEKEEADKTTTGIY